MTQTARPDRMFTVEGQRVKTWNPVTGCEKHKCIFCFARAEAEGRSREHYPHGFIPEFHEDRLAQCPKSGTVFVTSMGDLFGAWVPREWIEKVLARIRQSPNATFLLLTKNPARYHEFLPLPPNCVAGATIETDAVEDWAYSAWYKDICPGAPWPAKRAFAMLELKHQRKFISMEPVLGTIAGDFRNLLRWIPAIAPEFVYVGYDNHGHHLLEPSLAEVKAFIAELRQQGIEVREKTMRSAHWEKEV